MTEEKVILAALEEIKIHSLKFTMEDMTRRLHMSKTSLYKKVASKDALIADIVTYMIERFNREEQKRITPDMSIDEKNVALIQLYTDTVMPFNNAVFRDLQYLYEDQWQRWRTFQQEKIDELMAILQAGIDAGVYRPVNIGIMRYTLEHTVSALGDASFLNDNGLTYSEAIQGLRDIIFYGIKK